METESQPSTRSTGRKLKSGHLGARARAREWPVHLDNTIIHHLCHNPRSVRGWVATRGGGKRKGDERLGSLIGFVSCSWILAVALFSCSVSSLPS